jgi:hypothetical protein
MNPVIPHGLPAGYIVGSAQGCEVLVRGVPVLDMASLRGAPRGFIRASAVGRIESVSETAAPAPPSPARPSRRPRRGG